HLPQRTLAWSKNLLKKSFMSPPSAGSKSRLYITPRNFARSDLTASDSPSPRAIEPSMTRQLRAADARQRVLITSLHAVTNRDNIVLARLSDMFASAMAMVTSCASTELGSATTFWSKSSLLFCDELTPSIAFKRACSKEEGAFVPTALRAADPAVGAPSSPATESALS